MNLKTALVILGLILLAGCVTNSKPDNKLDGDGMEKGWREISQEEAKKMMEADDRHIILDVRTVDEYNGGHIPNAVCFPLDEIETSAEKRLPDKQQVILVYCRSGSRSKQAASILSRLGYKNIYEFGGIIDWDGAVVSEDDMEPAQVFCMNIDGHFFSFTPEKNETAQAFAKKLGSDTAEITMTGLDDTRKAGPVDWQLPSNAEEGSYEAGDILLLEDGQIAVCTGEGTGRFTKLADVSTLDVDEVTEALSQKDSVPVSFFSEWTE